MTSVFICESIITPICICSQPHEIVISKISVLTTSLIYFQLKTINKSLLFLLAAFPAIQNVRCI